MKTTLYWAMWLVACQPKAAPPPATTGDTVKVAPVVVDTVHHDTIGQKPPKPPKKP